jgi:hypothetical protein
MKTINKLALAGLIAVTTITACQRDISNELPVNNKEISAKPPAPPAVCNPNAYVITLESRTQVGSNWEWIWSVLNPNPGNGTNGTSQDMSHWGMQFGPCFTWTHVVGAAYSTDGVSYTAFTPTYQVDPSQSCLTTPVLKYNVGTSGTAKTYYKLVLSANYAPTNTEPGYYKSGSRMPCCTFTFTGVGCIPPGEGCSYSQGLYFGSSAPWPSPTVTVAGFVYTEAEGRAIWNTSNMGGLKDSKKAFLQVASIRLSGANVLPAASVWAYVAICESWLSTLGKLSPANLPTGNAAVSTAAGNIGIWINDHHCGPTNTKMSN